MKMMKKQFVVALLLYIRVCCILIVCWLLILNRQLFAIHEIALLNGTPRQKQAFQ